MHRIPPRVVLAVAGIAQKNKHRVTGFVPRSDATGCCRRAGLAIFPRCWLYVHAVNHDSPTVALSCVAALHAPTTDFWKLAQLIVWQGAQE